MTIYLDTDFRCHLTNDGTMQTIETDFFNNKCPIYIEGYRFVPADQTWIRSDGEVFQGEMVSPAIDYSILASAQAQYEADLVSMFDMENALNILGVTE